MEEILEQLLEKVRNLENRASIEVNEAHARRDGKMEVLSDLHGTIVSLQLDLERQSEKASSHK